MAVLFLIEGLGIVSDQRAAIVLAAWAAAVAARFVHEESIGEASWVRGGLAALALIAVLAPVGATLVPGEPALVAEVHQGDHVTLPDQLGGPVRILVHGRIAGGNGVIEYRLEGLEKDVSGTLERGSGLTKIGRRRVSQTHTRDTELVSASVGEQHELVVALARGALDGPLSLSFFNERWPITAQLGVALALLAATALVSWRRGRWEALVPAAAAASCFGIFAYRWLAPGNDFRPEIGALVVAVACGILAHIGVRWVQQRRAVPATL